MSRAEFTVTSRAPALSLPALALDLVAVGLVAAAGAMLAARLQVAPAALIMLTIGLGIRVVQYRSRMLTIPLGLPWLAFLLSSAVSAGIAFDPIAGQHKFLLILSGIALYFVLATLKTPLALRLVIWSLLLLCAGTGLYYVTQNDFVAEPAKFAPANAIGLLVHRIAPQFGWHTPHANLIAGILLLGLPFAFGECYNTARQKQWLAFTLFALVTLFTTFALFMTTSRGAWFAALVFVLLGSLVYGAMRLARRLGYSSNIGIAVLFNLILLLILASTALGGAQVSHFLDTVLGTVASVPRLDLYNQVLQLIQDYFWTGAGLDTFVTTYSTYLLLISVPFLYHAHNLYLQIWFEQGILGLIAFLWVLGAFYVWVMQRRKRIDWIALAGVAAVSMMLLHGLVDVPLYFSRVIPLMFIPFGLTIGALKPFKPQSQRENVSARRMNLVILGVVAVVGVCLLIIEFERPAAFRAEIEANRGALAQAALELPSVKFSDEPPAQVRRNTDLRTAEELYAAAIAIDPQNRAARARLGIIALDRYEFDNAVAELEWAYEADPHHRATIKALGYAYVWTGQLDKAEPLLKQIPEARIELNYAQGEWAAKGKHDLANNAATLIARLK